MKKRQALRAGLYAMVSTADQQTLPMQIAEMRDYAHRRGWTIVKELQDVNGRTKERPKREELIQMAIRRGLDVIVVLRLDRWGRSLADVVRSLQELHARKVDFASVSEGLDFSTPTGRAMSQMLSVFAQFERDVLRDRVRVGLEHARRRGKTLGRPATVQAQADKIRELLTAGVPKKTIAQQLGIGRASVYRAMEAMPSLKS
jgi:putative DNA-invertase from lambdoid prophage Rac